MRTIALIEDDPDLHELIRYNVEREGFRLVGSQTGKDTIRFLLESRPDLILLDIMLPDADGLDICREVRRHPELSPTPVIFLTARASEADRVLGLELGADDYVVKPFFIRELMARIKRQLRPPPPEQRLAAGELELDRTRMEVRRAGKPVPLTATEFRLLELLMSRPGRVFSRQQLLDQVWGYDRAVSERAVDVSILRLRQKLEPDSARWQWIHSVRGFGYTFDPERAAHFE